MLAISKKKTKYSSSDSKNVTKKCFREMNENPHTAMKPMILSGILEYILE